MLPLPPAFQTTLWSGVIRSAAGEQVSGGDEALAELCRRYWRPLFAFARASGAAAADAEDSTQAFFARLVAQRALLQRADPAIGRFRSFLLKAFKDHLADERTHRSAQKRGGGLSVISLDMEAQSLELQDNGTTPEQAYDRQWAREVVLRATNELRAEYVAAGKSNWFELIGGDGGSAQSLANIAGTLGTTEAAVKSFGQRMRRRLRLLLERQIADTLAFPEEGQDEMAYIAQLLRSEQ